MGTNTVYHGICPKSSAALVDLLGYGQDAAIPAGELCRITGKTARRIRLETEAARRAGVPVVADRAGYYIAETDSEVTACRRSLEARAMSLLYTASRLKRARLKDDRQTKMEEESV